VRPANSPDEIVDKRIVHLLMRPSSRSVREFNSEDLGYVLFGVANSATFFYPPFSLSGPAVYRASPRRAALHYFADFMIAENLGAEQIRAEKQLGVADLLPEFLKLLFVPQLTIQTAAARALIHLQNAISVAQCQQAIKEVALKEDTSDSDKFLLAIAMRKANGLSRVQQEHLFSFLREAAEGDLPSASLALVILFNEFDCWAAFAGSKQKLMAVILKLIVTGRHVLEVLCLFRLLGCAYFDLLVTTIRDFVKESSSRDRESVKLYCDTITYVSIHNASILGSRGCLELAKIANDFPHFAAAIETSLMAHIATFPNVAKVRNWLLVGDADGFLHVFKKNRFRFTWALFDFAIDIVSIHPTENWMAAFCNEESVLKWGTLSEKAQIKSQQVNRLDGPCEISWSGPNICSLRPKSGQ
jgi:hypothetical protein